MSVDEWKLKLVNFAKKSLLKYKGSDCDNEYYRSLLACINIFTWISSDNNLLTIQACHPEYGAAILTSEVVLDPLNWKLFIVGLDSWEYTVDAKGLDNSICDGKAAFLYCGDVPKDKTKTLLLQVDHELKKAESKRSNDRHSNNSDGGFQRTPGFIRSTCMKVLCAPPDTNVLFKDVAPPNITPQCSGFTDVGRHTGCYPRDTIRPLVFSILKVALKSGMIPPLAISDQCYTRFVVEYYLSLATEVKEKHQLSNGDVNLSMHYLKVVSRYVSTQSTWDFYWPDFLTMVVNECSSIRKHLEEITCQQARVDSERFKITLPDFTYHSQAYSPTLLVKPAPAVKASVECFQYDTLKTQLNLDWIHILDVKSLKHCKDLMENSRFDKNDAYSFSTVFVSIEMFLFQSAKDHLPSSSPSSSKQSPNQLSVDEIDMLVYVCDNYAVKLHAFKEACGTGIGGLLSNELLSHEVLIGWLKFCLLFKICCDHYSILSKFSVPLHYTDLEHLVLKDKWAWELLDLIVDFLRRHSNNASSYGVVFSGRTNEINDMFTFADQFVVAFSREYDAWWADEQKDAELRIECRWSEVTRKKEECRKLGEEIKDLRQNLRETRSERDSLERYIENARGQMINNPERKSFNHKVSLLENSLKSKEKMFERKKLAPAYLKQPLPPDAYYGKRSLFFIHMPSLLRHAWKASFQAQEMIFSKGLCMTPPVGTCDFHSFYNKPVHYRNAKESIGTPLALFVTAPPEVYGNNNVLYIIDRNDGVWYPNGFNPSLAWTSNKNPFNAHRKDAVERFSEAVTQNLNWTVNQHGLETPKYRGNLALSKLYSKPISMQREQFLTLGNLRSSPLLQLFHSLNSIKDTSLPCHDSFFQTTHTVLRHVLYHIGEIYECPSTKIIKKLWKWGIEHDQNFMDEFRAVLVDALDRVKEASKNENEFFIYLEIVSFFSQFDSNYLELMDQCSDIAYAWAERMEVEIQNARDKAQTEIILQTQKRRHLFLLYALVAYEMLVALPDCYAHEQRIRKVIELRLMITSSQPEQLTEKATNILCRIYFFLTRIYPVFQKHPTSLDKALTNTIKKVIPSYDDCEMQWNYLSSYCWRTKTKTGDHLFVNIMNGIVLVNDLPPSLLPLSIRTNKLFRRVFGEIDFKVTTGNDGIHKTQNPVKDRYYSFYMKANELLIFEEYDDHKLLLLNANDITSCSNHIPIGMAELYSHWLCIDTHIVLFRPVAFRDRTIYYILNDSGLYRVPLQYREKSTATIVTEILSFDKFLVLDQKMKASLTFFSKFDREEYMHTYLTHERVLRIVLVRYRISFELKQNSLFYDCSDFDEFKLRSIQQFDDKMYKFYNYLIFEKDSGEQTVIFPHGELKIANDIVSIDRPTLEIVDEIS